MKKKLLVVLLLVTQISFAQIPKPIKDTYVNDYAGVLTSAQITGLNKSIAVIEKQHAVQLAIVLVNKVPAAYDIQDFAVLIGKKWHVGKNKKGIVYVAAIKQRTQRIEVAQNLEDIFTADNSLTIMDGMKAPFKAKDYNGGLVELVNQITASLDEKEPVAQQAASTPVAPAQNAADAPKSKEDDGNALIGFLFIAGIVVAVVVYIRIRNKKRRAMQDFYNSRSVNNPGYYNAGPGGPNMGYGNPGYGMPPPQDHTFRNVAAGVIGGAVAGYAARAIQDDLSQGNNYNPNHPNYNPNYNNNTPSSYDDNNSSSSSSSDSSSWGNWGDSSDSGSSSSDSGFSDDSSSDSGATSNW